MTIYMPSLYYCGNIGFLSGIVVIEAYNVLNVCLVLHHVPCANIRPVLLDIGEMQGSYGKQRKRFKFWAMRWASLSGLLVRGKTDGASQTVAPRRHQVG